MSRFKSFNFFTEDIFNDLSKEMRRLYVTPTQHRISYLANNGFTDWLESFRDETLTLNETFSVTQTYIDYGDRKVEEVHTTLASICHQYGVELPAEEGILTADYWVNKNYYEDSENSM